jgi:hypothetical protein
MRKTFIACFLAVAAAAVSAQTSVPFTFSAGSPAKAADVNANFSALVTAVNGLTARVAKLEGQVTQADLAGTYSFQRFQTEIGGDPGSHVAVYVASGTLTLAADGTGSFTQSPEAGTQLNVQARSAAPFNGSGAADGNITWSYSGGAVNAFGKTLAVVAGGRMLVGTGTNPGDGTAVLLLMTRLN